MTTEVDAAREEIVSNTPVRSPLLERVQRHPYVAVALVAALARLVIVVVGLVATSHLVPDEVQYLELARWMADGHAAARLYNGYGQSLLNATSVFVRPLVVFAAIGAPRVLGSVMVVAYGVATAVGATWLARRVTSARCALGAGMVVALLPSQAFFSSAVVRESLVWAACVAVAVGAASANCADDRRRLWRALLLAALGLLWLGGLRDQVLLAAAWSLPVAMLFGRAQERVLRVAIAVAMAIVLPIAGSTGPGGLTLMQRFVPVLGTLRVNLSMGADSAFTSPSTIAPTTSTTAPPTTVALPAGPGGPLPTTTTTTTTIVAPPGSSIVHGYDGELYLADETAGASFRAAPRGAIAVLFRPFPWQSVSSATMRLARAENLAWYAMYVLAAIGLFAIGWRRRRVLAFPVLLAVGILASASVTQGNVGTAFRQRGQLLWIVAVFAAAGAERVGLALRHRRVLPGRSGERVAKRPRR